MSRQGSASPVQETGLMTAKIIQLKTTLELREKEIEFILCRLKETEASLSDAHSAYQGALDKMVAIEDLFIDNLEVWCYVLRFFLVLVALACSALTSGELTRACFAVRWLLAS